MAHLNLFLSEGTRKVTHMREKQPYPDHPERFDWQPQVLSPESLTGCHYWEVEWSTRMWVEIAVTYKGTRCTGADNDYAFGLNARSWVLFSGIVHPKMIILQSFPHAVHEPIVFLNSMEHKIYF